MVNGSINHVLPSIEHFHIWGYWFAFFAALLETTIGIGLFLPESTVILFLGALSARGYLNTGDLIWFAVLVAILGDYINYYLGKRYGAKSVFLGRFVPGIKEIVPFIAGSVK